MPDVSIAISVKDNFTDAITTMQNANQSFNKDLTGTMEKLDELNRTKYQLKIDTDQAKRALKDAEKQYAQTGDAADKANRDMAAANYDNAKRNLNLVSQNARQAEKDILGMTGAIEKSDNRASRLTNAKESGTSGITNLLHGLAGAGMTKMIGDSLSGVADAYIGSAFNDETENMVGGVLSGITSGAAIGTMAEPGVGTAIGAAAGAATGAVNGLVKNFQDEDNAFKSVVQDEYNSVQQEESDALSAGSTIAETREGDLRAFTTLLNGNGAAAKNFQNSLIDIGRTKLSYDTVADLSKRMLGLGDTTDEAKKKINDLDEAATGLSWSDSTVSSVSAILEQIEESGTASSRMLKTLEKNGVQAHDIIANAFHIKKADVDKELSKLDATSVVNAIYNAMGTKFQGSIKTFEFSYEGMMKQVQSYENDLNSSMGQGYNEESKKGLQEEIKTMQGSTGSALKEAYSMEGKFKADLENAQKELLDNALTSVTSGKVTGNFSTDHRKELQQLASDYQKQMTLADKGNQEAEEQAAKDVEKAKIIAQNEYKATEGYQLELQGDRDLAEAIGKDTALQQDYWKAGYDMGQWFSKGRAYYVGQNDKDLHAPTVNEPGQFSADMPTHITAPSKNATPIQKAIGSNRIPYNNYPALLHEDERVLTGVEARSQRSNGSVHVEISGPVTIRKESDIDDIANQLFRKLQKADAITP